VECLEAFGGFRRTPVGPNIFGATSAKLVRTGGCRLIRHASATCAGLALLYGRIDLDGSAGGLMITK
jgi:hypothetical protein